MGGLFVHGEGGGGAFLHEGTKLASVRFDPLCKSLRSPEPLLDG